MSKVSLLFGLFGLCLASGTATAQSLQAFMVEMDRKLDMIERRLESLEADRAQRADAERANEAERQRAAILELARQCASFRGDKGRVDRHKACVAQKATGEQRSVDCMSLELDALSCR